MQNELFRGHRRKALIFSEKSSSRRLQEVKLFYTFNILMMHLVLPNAALQKHWLYNWLYKIKYLFSGRGNKFESFKSLLIDFQAVQEAL